MKVIKIIQKKDLQIISHLRKDGRKSLTKMSRETGIPVSTIFDRLSMLKEKGLVRNTSLIDFEKLGYNTKIYVALATISKQKEELINYLKSHQNINNLSRINSGYDFLFEAVFPSFKESKEFLEELDNKFEISKKQVFNSVEDISKESLEIFSNMTK